MMRFWIALTILLTLSQNAAASDRIYTYFEGYLQKKTSNEWVVITEEGTYWLTLRRSPSWVHRLPHHRISFWVAADQIVRFRPVVLTPDDSRHIEFIAKQP